MVRSRLCEKQRKFADAVPYLNEYLTARPADVWALSNRGLALFESGNPTGAFDDWSRSANASDAFSQNRLGVLYVTGIPGHLAPDVNWGIQWLEKPAAQGNQEAQHNLLLTLAQNRAQGAVH